MQVLGFLLLLALGGAQALRMGEPEDPRALLLSSVPQLVFRQGFQTVSGGRTKPVPQLSCTRGAACGTQHEPSSVLCENIGEDYNTGDPNWKCTADLPTGVKLGTTDVVCEGYRSKTDKYVLKGSCALDYTLVGSAPGGRQGGHHEATGGHNWWNWVFAFALLWVVGKWLMSGGGGGGSDERPMRPAPAPPQYRAAPQPAYASSADCGSSAASSGAGFWQGAALGGMGGYLARSAMQASSTTYSPQPSYRASPSYSASSSPSRSTSTSYATTSRRG